MRSGADIRSLVPRHCERPHGVGCLSAPQRHVAVLVAQGHTNREVANGLSISIKTVEFHLSSMYVQLGLRNRTELARMIGESGSGLPDASTVTDKLNGEGGP
jgi:DNA-binding CsgD family transcriptional regulator